jgi:hypothetical protein
VYVVVVVVYVGKRAGWGEHEISTNGRYDSLGALGLTMLTILDAPLSYQISYIVGTRADMNPCCNINYAKLLS